MAYTGMTCSIVLRYLNRMLGTVIQELEISEEEMMRVVFQQTLRTYSIYFPYKYRMQITGDDYLSGTNNTYKIPKTDNLEIIGIHKLFMSNMVQYGSTAIPISQNPFESQIFNDFASMTVTPITWRYLPPNLIEIFPKILNYKSAILEVKAIHPKHLKTIPLNMSDEFLKLALYDVLLSIYPLRHRFESMNTVYGSIQPFLDMVDSAKDDRDALLEKFRENLLRDGNAKRIWIG